jgi:hypothetical protein
MSLRVCPKPTASPNADRDPRSSREFYSRERHHEEGITGSRSRHCSTVGRNRGQRTQLVLSGVELVRGVVVRKLGDLLEIKRQKRLETARDFDLVHVAALVRQESQVQLSL